MDILSRIIDRKMVSIIRKLNYDKAIKTIDCLYSNGVTVFEVTLNTDRAFDIIRYAKEKYKDEVVVGVGTVLSKEDVLNSVKAGAQFVLTPNLYDEVVTTCIENDLLVIPGVLTPSEIAKAMRLGCKIVKLFPVTSMGDNYIKQIKAPLDSIKIMAVGGINSDNMMKYLENGADCVGVGSIIDNTLINNNNFNELEKHIQKFVKKLNNVN